MKRPQGLDRPAGERVRPAGAGEQSRGERDPGRPSPSRRWPVRRRRSEGPDVEPAATTEPIAVVADRTASAAEPADAAPRRESAAQLRRAARARRRYERHEVKRFTRRTRRRRAIALTVAGSLVTVMLAAVVTAFSPFMAVRTITVTGTSRIDAGAVRSALDELVGTPLPLVDPTEVRTELARFPLIRSYSTESRPPGTFVVHIVERRPLAVVKHGEGYAIVDPAGVVIETGSTRSTSYPLIEVDSVSSPGFRAAAAVLTALPSAVRGKVDTVSASTRDDVSFVLHDGASVVWGSRDRSALKARVLTELLAATAKKDVDEYDVSSPMSPVTR